MIDIHWWEDSGCRRTIHKNERGLSFKESLLGEIGGSDVAGWSYKLVESNEWVSGFKTMDEAMEEIQKRLNGKRIDY